MTKFSVIILFEEAEEGFVDYLNNLQDIFTVREQPFEILIIANGTEGYLKDVLGKTATPFAESVKIFALNKRTTQAACLKAGFKECQGDIILVCGSYQQITNKAFEALLNAISEDVDIVSPCREKRVDPAFNQFQSKVFNKIANFMTGSSIKDLSCTVKVFRRIVLENIELYGNMYRYLPILAESKGFKNKEIECEHLQERGKTGFYNIYEYFSRLIDIFTIFFTTRYTWKPLRFFSAIGSVFILIGISIMLYIFYQKIFMSISIGDRLELLLGILFMVLGIQTASTGLLGEIITFVYGRRRKEYSIEKII